MSEVALKSSLSNQESETKRLRKQLGDLTDSLVTLIRIPTVVDPADFHLRQVTGTNMTLETGTQRFTELDDDEDQGAPLQDGGQMIALA